MFKFGLNFGRKSGLTAPVSDKIITHLSTANTSNILKKDLVNGYDFTIQNCPNDNILDNLLATVTDLLGAPMWFTQIFTGWGCEYLAPASGSPGHNELLAIDDGSLFVGFTPIANVQADFEAWSNNQMFWSARGEVLIYTEVLTGSELAEVQAYL